MAGCAHDPFWAFLAGYLLGGAVIAFVVWRYQLGRD